MDNVTKIYVAISLADPYNGLHNNPNDKNTWNLCTKHRHFNNMCILLAVFYSSKAYNVIVRNKSLTKLKTVYSCHSYPSVCNQTSLMFFFSQDQSLSRSVSLDKTWQKCPLTFINATELWRLVLQKTKRWSIWNKRQVKVYLSCLIVCSLRTYCN